MWLDDDDLDPDSDAGRALMMEALDVSEAVLDVSAPSTIAADVCAQAHGHSYHIGPPRLVCSVPWGLMLLREANPSHSALVEGAEGLSALELRRELSVRVDWQDLTAEAIVGPAALRVRRHGQIVTESIGHHPLPLSVAFSVADAAPGDVFIAELTWQGGSRHLHCLAPLHTAVRLDGLLAPPLSAAAPLPSTAALLAPDHYATAWPLLHLPDRAIGLELELLTLAPDPERSGFFTKAEEVDALLTRLLQHVEDEGGDGDRGGMGGGGVAGGAAAPGASSSAAAANARLRELLVRCREWSHEVDDHVVHSSSTIAQRAASEALSAKADASASMTSCSISSSGNAGAADVTAERKWNAEEVSEYLRRWQVEDAVQAAVNSAIKHKATDPVLHVADALDSTTAGSDVEGEDGSMRDQLARLHGGGAGTMKSEFKSPPPDAPHGALNLAKGGGECLRTFVRAVHCLGAGAPALSSTANGGGSCHVHVNVRHPTAGGDVLSCEEILSVWLSWVQFDLVTMRFARPWMWREPSMAPLYATGSEFAWRESAWAQGGTRAFDAATYDVPTFVRAVRALYADADFESLSEDAKLERIFGRGKDTPATRIGRYCSLNLRRLTGYGTLEFRRFHCTLDEGLLLRWAHFCAAFVECFRRADAMAMVLGASSHEEALGRISVAQEAATPRSLMEAMEGYVDGRTAELFMRNSGAQPAASVGLPELVIRVTGPPVCGDEPNGNDSALPVVTKEPIGDTFVSGTPTVLPTAGSESEHVTIPEGTTELADGAFAGRHALRHVSLPSSLRRIGRNAFEGCASLTLTRLPDGVKEIAESAFRDCSSLALTHLPDGLTDIASNAFQNCTSLALTSLPDSVNVIAPKAFSGCSRLALTSLPNACSPAVGEGAFENCSSVALTSLPHGFRLIPKAAFAGCSALALRRLPNSVESIADHAFSGCSGLALTRLPDGLHYIGEHAFAGCSSLALTGCLPRGLTYVSKTAFGGCRRLALDRRGMVVARKGLLGFANGPDLDGDRRPLPDHGLPDGNTKCAVS